MEKIKREIEEAAADRLSIDDDVLLGQMPAARPHEERRSLVVEPVSLPFRRGEVDAPADGVAQVELALHVVVPLRRVGVLEIGHEHGGTRVEGVDDHLAVDGSRDLDASVENVRRNGGAGPVSLADRVRFRQKIGQLARVELSLPLRTASEQLCPPVAKSALQLRREPNGVGREDFRVLGCHPPGNLDARAKGSRVHSALVLDLDERMSRNSFYPNSCCAAADHPRTIRPQHTGTLCRDCQNEALRRNCARAARPAARASLARCPD